MSSVSRYIIILSLLLPVNTMAQSSLQTFLPRGYVLFDSAEGDLNKDGIADKVLLIKATDSSRIVVDEYKGRLDRNRRGIVVLVKEPKGYRKVFENRECFSSENEDGGVYFAPELSILIKKGNLVFHYGHGRYGYWSYTFRYREKDLELIGYDEMDGAAPVKSETSINLLTGKKKYSVNTNENAEGGDEVFKTTWSNIKKGKLTKLSAVKDFDEFRVTTGQEN